MFELIPITRNLKPKAKPNPNERLGFGEKFTDHMFCMDYTSDAGWQHPRIVPYAPLQIDPSAKVFHYGQAVFEGLKAYRNPQGGVQLFRPRLNFERLSRTHERMVLPPIDVDFCLHALKTLLRLEQDWVPAKAGTSLYIRPCVIATDPYLGIHPSQNYLFLIILSPSDPYYAQGLKPVDIHVETDHVRAVRGGTGEAKAAGNYAASFHAQIRAQDQGYVQVLWLDGTEQRYIEEVGLMNVFFVIDGILVTPQLSGTILPGITRRSVIELAKRLGYATQERPITIDEIVEGHDQGRVSEVFGSGTAAIIAPVGKLYYKGRCLAFGQGQIGPLSQKLYDRLTGLQYGLLADEDGWIEKI